MRLPRPSAPPFIALLLLASLLCSTPSGALTLAGYNVALFPFSGAHDSDTEQSRIATDILEAQLSAESRIRLVERSRLNAVLAELSLSLTGIVSEEEALRAGSMAGAQIMVTGRITVVDGDLLLVGRVIGVETSRVETVLVSAGDGQSFGTAAAEMAAAVTDIILTRAHDLLGGGSPAPPATTTLSPRLADRNLPSLSLAVDEYLNGRDRKVSATETEMLRLFSDAGFELYGREAAETDVRITGEAIGVFAARTGDLVTTKVEISLRALATGNGKILAVARQEQTAVDLSVELAAARAFREAAAAALPAFLLDIVDAWNE